MHLFLTTYAVLAFHLAAQVGGGGRAERGRPWPLPIRINLTSSFGEFRDGHPHAGLDLKTYGKDGVPCRAVDDGYVARLRASPSGYGKAVYLRLSTGETVVYAHLSEFSPALEEALYEAQNQAGRYRVDLYFGPERFGVRSGEIVGYTGSTGASAPHLHFEVRDANENPVNPLSRGWVIEDHTPPRFDAVLFLPLSKTATIDGRCYPREIKLARVDRSTYVAEDTLCIEGVVGLGAHIVDKVNRSSGRLAPHRVEFLVDDALLSEMELETFSYGIIGEAERVFEMERARSGGKHFMLLFHRPGESLWNRKFRHRGLIDTGQLVSSSPKGSGVHTAVIRAVDRAGNASVAKVPFVAGGGPGLRFRGTARGEERPIQELYAFDDVLSLPRNGWSSASPAPAGEAVDGLLSKAAALSADRSRYTLSVGDLNGASVLTLLAEGGDWGMHVAAVRAGSGFSSDFPDLAVRLDTGPRSLYGDAFVLVSPWPEGIGRRPEPWGDLTPSSNAVRIGPLSLAVRSGVEVRFALGRPCAANEAVFQWSEKKREWKFVPTVHRADTALASVRQPGIYGVFADRRPPKVRAPVVQKITSYATGAEMLQIVVPIEDKGSGLDDDKTEIYLNGKKIIARWDTFAEKMFVLLRGEPIIETNHLSIIAFDQVGNVARSEKTVRIPELFTGTEEREAGEIEP